MPVVYFDDPVTTSFLAVRAEQYAQYTCFSAQEQPERKKNVSLHGMTMDNLNKSKKNKKPSTTTAL